MEMIPVDKAFLEDVAKLRLTADREARLVVLSARRRLGPLTDSEESEFRAWNSLRDKLAYFRNAAQQLLGEAVN